MTDPIYLHFLKGVFLGQISARVCFVESENLISKEKWKRC